MKCRRRCGSDTPRRAPTPATRSRAETGRIGHPEKMIDFGYRSTHEMTLKAKQIVKTFYDQNAKYSYFKGCSTGGRMALMEAQRYPDDYDGIIAGSLANRHIHMWTAGVARSIELSRHPEGNLTAEKAALVNQMVTSTCDTLKEGFLNNPRQCKVDFSKLLCAAGKDDGTCLTAAQLKTVNTFYGGVKNSKGELIFSGQALGNPIGALRGTNQSPGGTFDIVRIAFNDPNLDWQKFDLDRDMPLIDKAVGYVDSVDPDLGKFKKSGGKLLLTHGWADTGITPETTIWYYDSVLDKMGKNQSDWMRLFMAPGMGHCGGGPGVNTFDSIGTLEKWVEKGIAPDQMMGTGAQGLTRPLCPYPQYAEYKGTGDLERRGELGLQSAGAGSQSEIERNVTMIASIASLLLGAAAAAATPCESLTSLKFVDATITSAVVVPEGPPAARGGGGGAAPRRRSAVQAPAAPVAAGKHSGSLPRSDDAQANIRLPDQHGALAADAKLERQVHGRRQRWFCRLHSRLEQRHAAGAATRVRHGRHRYGPPGTRRQLGHRPS